MFDINYVKDYVENNTTCKLIRISYNDKQEIESFIKQCILIIEDLKNKLKLTSVA